MSSKISNYFLKLLNGVITISKALKLNSTLTVDGVGTFNTHVSTNGDLNANGPLNAADSLIVGGATTPGGHKTKIKGNVILEESSTVEVFLNSTAALADQGKWLLRNSLGVITLLSLNDAESASEGAFRILKNSGTHTLDLIEIQNGDFKVVDKILDPKFNERLIYGNESAAADTKYYDFYVDSSGHMYIRTLNDAYLGANNIITFTRAGGTISKVSVNSHIESLNKLSVNESLDSELSALDLFNTSVHADATTQLRVGQSGFNGFIMRWTPVNQYLNLFKGGGSGANGLIINWATPTAPLASFNKSAPSKTWDVGGTIGATGDITSDSDIIATGDIKGAEVKRGDHKLNDGYTSYSATSQTLDTTERTHIDQSFSVTDGDYGLITITMDPYIESGDTEATFYISLSNSGYSSRYVISEMTPAVPYYFTLPDLSTSQSHRVNLTVPIRATSTGTTGLKVLCKIATGSFTDSAVSTRCVITWLKRA